MYSAKDITKQIAELQDWKRRRRKNGQSIIALARTIEMLREYLKLVDERKVA